MEERVYFGLRLQRGVHNGGGGKAASGRQGGHSRQLRDHIFSHKHEVKRTRWKLTKAIKSQNRPPMTLSSKSETPHQTVPSTVWWHCLVKCWGTSSSNNQACERYFRSKSLQTPRIKFKIPTLACKWDFWLATEWKVHSLNACMPESNLPVYRETTLFSSGRQLVSLLPQGSFT